MFLQTKNSKKIIVAAALLVLAVFAGYAHQTLAAGASGSWDGPATPPSDAGSNDTSGGGSDILEYVFWGIGALGYLVMKVIAFLAFLIGHILEKAVDINLNFKDYKDVVIVGWKLSRDIANMFFIFILLFIAITTMLRVSGYETKVLLRKLIVIALLINFSLTIGLVIVDATNVLGNEFYNGITNNRQSAISTVLTGSTNAQKFWQASASQMDKVDDQQTAENFAVATWLNAIILIVLIVVILFMAVLFIIRIAALAFLLILAPIAFIGAILPKTEGIWDKWWKSFLDHCFYFPASLFMLYFAVAFVNLVNAKYFPAGPNGPLPENLRSDGAVNLLLVYLISSAMMIGSLMLAKQMSFTGAGAVVGWAKMSGGLISGAIIGGAINQTIGRLGQKIQTAAPNSYLASRVSSTMAGMGKMSPLGSRSQQHENEAKFKLAALSKQSTTAQMEALKASKNPVLRKGLAKNLLDDEKALASIAKKKDPGEIDTLRREIKLVGGVKDEKKLDDALLKSEIRSQAAIGKLSEFFKNLATEKEQHDAMKLMNRDDIVTLMNAGGGKDGKNEDKELTQKLGKAISTLPFEEREKVNAVVRSASNDGANAMQKDAEERAQSATTPEEKAAAELHRDNISRNMSGGQQAYIWEQKLKEGGDAAKNFASRINGLSAEEGIKFGKAQTSSMQAKSLEDLRPIWKHLPEQLRVAIFTGMKQTKALALHNGADTETQEIMRKDMDKAGMREKIDKSPGKRVAAAAGDPKTTTKIIIKENFGSEEGPRESIKFNEKGQKTT